MPLPIGLQAGPQNLGRNSPGILRAGNTGEALVSEFLPPYAQAGFDGLGFSAANQAAQAVSAALATSYTGLLLYNPIGSGVILVPKLAKFVLTVAPAAIASLGIISGVQTLAPTGLTAVAPVSSQVGNAATGKGLVYSVATINTPVWRTQMVDGFTAAAFPAPAAPYDFKGDVQILPGGFIAIGALTTVTGLGSLSWNEHALAS